MLSSPFTCGGVVKTITLNYGYRATIRAMDADSLLISVNKPVVAGSKVDYILNDGESATIDSANPDDARAIIINMVNETGDPTVYYRIEPIT